jgi:hypothetical protein
MFYEKEELWVSLQNCPSLIVWAKYIEELKEEREINSQGYVIKKK